MAMERKRGSFGWMCIGDTTQGFHHTFARRHIILGKPRLSRARMGVAEGLRRTVLEPRNDSFENLGEDDSAYEIPARRRSRTYETIENTMKKRPVHPTS